MKVALILLAIYILLASILSICGLSNEAAGNMTLLIMVLFPIGVILYYNLTPSGRNRVRAIRITSLRNERKAKESDKNYSNIEEIPNKYEDSDEEEDYFDKWYDRHMRWIEGMKDRCTLMSGSKGDDDYYYSSFLLGELPLNNFENYAGTPEFNYIVSEYIDWDDFREWYPGLETYEWDEYKDESDDYQILI